MERNNSGKINKSKEIKLDMSFLKAEWRRLALANYEIDPKILKPYLPHKTELDIWNGVNYVSLVGFMFKNTKIKGIPIPYHINFEEVNLRFYVKHKDGNEWKRGVVFIKEIVPKFAISFVANNLYKEHYETMKMKHKWEETESKMITEYSWLKKNEWQTFKIISNKNQSEIEANSETEFITEHYFGYTKIDSKKTYEYEVKHPKWNKYEVFNYEINVDFNNVYGEDFKLLNELTPKSVMLAEGSEISVENKRKI